MRAFLIVPGDDPERLRNALAAAPDTLVIDIEAGGENASSACRREGAAAFLRDAGRGGSGTRIFVRINPFDSGCSESDLEATMPGAPHGIMLPGAVGRPAFERLAARLAVLEALHGLPDRETRIIPSVGDAAGALAMGSLAASGPRLAGLACDEGRLRRKLGLEPSDTSRNGSVPEPCRHLRAMTVLTARAAGVMAIDGPYPELSDPDGLAAETEQVRRDGFAAKLVLTEAQAAIVGRAG